MDSSGYMALLESLNVNRRGDKVAPHKAVLLLALVDLFEQGVIDSPFIPISKALELRFKEVWRKYVAADSGFACNLQYPFYHLGSSDFWELVRTPSWQPGGISSMAALRRNYSGARIPDDLFALLASEEFRLRMRRTLLSSYLRREKSGFSGSLIPALCLLASTMFIA